MLNFLLYGVLLNPGLWMLGIFVVLPIYIGVNDPSGYNGDGSGTRWPP